jgi:hypothetical protein
MIRVAVVYALLESQRVFAVDLLEGGSVRDAIEASGLMNENPEIDLAHAAVGIFGERVSLDTRVEGGDRIEIYRPLKADPKIARRARAGKRRG